MLNNKIIKILIIGDEPQIIDLLTQFLNKDEYDLLSTKRGKEGIDIAKSYLPEIVIMDILLPDIDSIEVCEKIREIKEMKNAIIVFLSARHEDYNQISAFNAGADDFIKKPISPKVFIAKINVYINKYIKTNIDINNKPDSNPKIELKNLIIYSNGYSILKDNKLIQLPKKEFDLLVYLAINKNKVVSRDDIYNKLWGDKSQVLDRTIDVHIRKLRKKIGNNRILTFKKSGYRFIE